MPRAAAIFRHLPLLLTVLAAACGPDDSGIRRLPLEPESVPAVLTVSPSATVLPYIGASKKLTASITPDGAAGGFAYQWTSMSPGVATVANNGTVAAVTEGEAKIIVRILNLVDTATITVKRLPAVVELDPDTVLFTELDATTTITAAVRDGGGVDLPNDEILWSSSDTSVATVSGGVITSVGQGLTTVKATAGGIVATVRVRVAVGPAEMAVSPSEVTLAALGDTVRLTAEVTDAAGEALDSIDITFESDNPGIATVSETGLVTAVAAGSTSILVSGDTVRTTVQVRVNQVPAGVTVTPEGVKAVAGAQITYAAVVVDANDSVIANPSLTWSTTDVAVATLAGAVATAVGPGVVGIVATAGTVADTVGLEVVVPVVDSIAVDVDTLMLEEGQAGQLTAELFDDTGTLLVGATPDWTTDDAGVATVDVTGKVTAVAEGNTWIRAQADAGADSTYVMVSPPPPAYDLEVRYVGGDPDAATQAAFAAAEARWEAVITADLTDIPVTANAGDCGVPHPALSETVDDLLIFAEITAIDGPGGVLGQAGPCLIRNTGGLTIVGKMQFDEDDLATLLGSGLLDETILHEMGHVIGLGALTVWEDILVDKGSADPYWPGTVALAEYQLGGGVAVNAVPIENTGGEGTQDAHWRETDMGREIMTGFLNSGSNPMSSITIGALDDIGYTVDMDEADAYTVSAALRMPGPVFQLRDIVDRPRFTVDEFGNVRPIGNR